MLMIIEHTAVTLYCHNLPNRLMDWISKLPQEIAQITISCEFEILFSSICTEPTAYICDRYLESRMLRSRNHEQEQDLPL